MTNYFSADFHREFVKFCTKLSELLQNNGIIFCWKKIRKNGVNTQKKNCWGVFSKKEHFEKTPPNSKKNGFKVWKIGIFALNKTQWIRKWKKCYIMMHQMMVTFVCTWKKYIKVRRAFDCLVMLKLHQRKEVSPPISSDSSSPWAKSL